MPPIFQSLYYKNNLMAARSEDDFTFPATIELSERFLESPPLWRPSPPSAEKLEETPDKRGSLQEFEKIDDFFREEERMDVLWENLNDESSKNGVKMAEIAREVSSSSPGRGVQISCAQSLKLSRANGHMFSGKKPIIFMFINVVKKVLLMQSTHNRIKKQAW